MNQNDSQAAGRIRILVADDSTLLRTLITHQLQRESDFEVVAEATNGRDAVDLAGRILPDVVLMDLDMPILNGVQATERIMAQFPYMKVILLTSHEELASIGKFSGTFASLNKNTTPGQISELIREAYASRKRGSGASGVGDYHTKIELIAIRQGLTDLEKIVLESVVGAEMTMEQIAATLGGRLHKPMTVSSVKHTLQRVMTKLRIEPRTRAALVKYVLEVGSR